MLVERSKFDHSLLLLRDIRRALEYGKRCLILQHNVTAQRFYSTLAECCDCLQGVDICRVTLYILLLTNDIDLFSFVYSRFVEILFRGDNAVVEGDV